METFGFLLSILTNTMSLIHMSSNTWDSLEGCIAKGCINNCPGAEYGNAMCKKQGTYIYLERERVSSWSPRKATERRLRTWPGATLRFQRG